MRPYRSRKKRVKNPPRVIITPRDLDIFEALHTHTMLRQDQICDVFFKGVYSTAQPRLRLLYDAKYIDRKFTDDTNRSYTVYVLDKRGAEKLREERIPDLKWHSSYKRVADQSLKHTLYIADVWTAFTVACQRAGYEIHWTGERALKGDYDYVTIRDPSGRQRKQSIIPDGYFYIVAKGNKYPFFLELDNVTMPTNRFKRKVLAYMSYYRTGGYERRFKNRSLRILTVASGKTEKRTQNLKETAEKANAPNWFWFAYLNDINADSILKKPIWQYAGNPNSHSLF